MKNESIERKEEYKSFVEKNYVQIYSQPWWMDAICGSDNWDVWLYKSGGSILAAMPYYLENRGNYKYVTRAPFTQINGILFAEKNENERITTTAEREEKIINAAIEYIEGLGLDVYEQQYPYSFTNWSPFFWHRYSNQVRYTYVIESPGNKEEILDRCSSSYRNCIKKGLRNVEISENISEEEFYQENKKVFDKQGIEVNLKRDMWSRMIEACTLHNCGKLICAKDELGNNHGVMYLVWDEQAMYPILGGYNPEYSYSQGYPALTYYSICLAGEMGLKYDFEGSMIKNVAHSFRQFGGTPMPYYRIRKVFNPEIVRKEAEDYILNLNNE